MTLAWIYWDPNRFAFTVPIINRPVAWYGLFFALGFLLGFLIILPIIKRYLQQTKIFADRDVESWPILIANLRMAQNNPEHPLYPVYELLNHTNQQRIKLMRLKQEPDQYLKIEILSAINTQIKNNPNKFSRKALELHFGKGIATLKTLSLYLTDRLTWFIMAGTIIGARLGHIFFYDWPRYKENPLDMLKIWEGGLASHGGTIGVMLAIYVYQRYIHNRFPEFSFITLLDIVAIPTALAAVWIRIGNFFNQEITGPITNVPWAIIFGHPIDGGEALPRHPTQLYEAAAYLLTFVVLYALWNKKFDKLKEGTIIGLFMMMVFGFRFLIEFVKTPQSLVIEESFLSMGQYLSIPFIVLGIYLFFRETRERNPSAIKESLKI